MALPDRIKVSMEFMQPNVLKQWLTSEHPIVPEEDVIEEFKSSKALLVAAFKSMNQGLDISIDYSAGHPMNVTQVSRSQEEVIKDHLQTISECKTLRNLEMFANMVQRENEPVLFDAYNNKKKELQ